MFPSTPRMLVRQPGRRIIMWSPNRKQEGLASEKQNFSSKNCSRHLGHRFNTPAVYFFCSKSKFNENFKIFSSKPLFLQHVPSETNSVLLTILPIFFREMPGMSFLKCEHLIKSRKFLQKKVFHRNVPLDT